MASLNVGDIAIERPAALSACDIAQLEDHFAASSGNVEALRHLQDELRYRQSPQALALLNQIQNTLAVCERRLMGSRFGRQLDRLDAGSARWRVGRRADAYLIRRKRVGIPAP